MPMKRYMSKTLDPNNGELIEAWQDMFDMIAKILIYEPGRRLPLAEALRHSFFGPIKNQVGTFRAGSATSISFDSLPSKDIGLKSS